MEGAQAAIGKGKVFDHFWLVLYLWLTEVFRAGQNTMRKVSSGLVY